MLVKESLLWESPLFESPDMIEARNLNQIFRGIKNLSLDDFQIPFGYFNGKIVIGKINSTHTLMKDFYPEIEDSKMSRHNLKYSGRIWINEKIISFWDYPETHKALYDILSDIEKEFYQKFKKPLTINPNNWYIEIIDKSLDRENYDNIFMEWGNAEESILISVKDYKGSGEWSEEKKGQDHVKSPLLKIEKEVPSGFGSEKSKYKTLASKQAMYTENLVPSFKEFLEL